MAGAPNYHVHGDEPMFEASVKHELTIDIDSNVSKHVSYGSAEKACQARAKRLRGQGHPFTATESPAFGYRLEFDDTIEGTDVTTHTILTYRAV